jgi:arachidonate 15-lipoxygenase
MSAFLPQSDPDLQARAANLVDKRKEYQYNHTYVSPLTFIDKVPRHEEFSWKWLVQIGERVLQMVENRIEVEGDPHHKAAHQERHSRFRELLHAASCDIVGIIHVIKESICNTPIEGRVESLDDFPAMFQAFQLPGIAKDYQEDSVFAEMRVAGPNPLMLQQVTLMDDRLAVTEEHFPKSLIGDSLDATWKEGRLFLADYRMLEGAENGHYPKEQKYLYAPLAYFVVDRKTGRLVPMAIQCQQIPGPDNPIFTPDDGVNWLIAKTIVGIADGNVHEAVAHFGRTHMFAEPFAIATHRQLAVNHPLYLLLQPHFEGTFAINCMARTQLINDNGPCDHMMAGTIAATRGLAAKGWQSNHFEQAMLPNRLEELGLQISGPLKHYPYRDDALPYWKAIRKWVSDYLALCYPSNADLQQDTELKGWLAELAADDAGRVPGFKFDGTVSHDYLTDVLTMVIFTCSVQHAAVNFPQYDLMSYVPNMPLAGYTPAPTKKKGGTVADLLKLLPPRHAAELQVNLGYILGSLHYTRLGNYGWRHFTDKRVLGPLETFEKTLYSIGKAIDERNKTRRPYTFLTPMGIPQSINV